MSELAVGSLAGLAANSYVIDVASGSSLDLSNGATLPAGSIIAVKDVLKTDTFSASVSAGGNVAVTDLSITHEVSNPTNKLIITAFFGAAADSEGFRRTSLAISDGTNLIGVGDAAGSRTQVTAGGGQASTSNINTYSAPGATFVHTPGAGEKTYTVRAVNMNTFTATVYVNRNEDDSDFATRPRAVSSLVIMEVAV